MENDICAILASLPDEEQARQLSHEELLKTYCTLYRFTCQLAQVVSMQAQLDSLQKKVDQLQEENRELRRKLNANSDTAASIPPSQDTSGSERRDARKDDKDWQEEQSPQIPRVQEPKVIEEVLRTMSAIATFSPKDEGEDWDEKEIGGDIIARCLPDERLSMEELLRHQLASAPLEKDEDASSLSPARQPHWDEHEVAILLDTAEKVARKELERPYAVRRLSQILRMRLAAKDFPLDEKTRNEAGIQLQLHWMERYLETGQARNISKLFIKIARLRADAPDRYAALLRRAKEELEELGIR